MLRPIQMHPALAGFTIATVDLATITPKSTIIVLVREVAAMGGHPGGDRPDTRENGYGQLSCHVGRAWNARAAQGAPHHHGGPVGCAAARRRGFLGKAIALRVPVPDL